jgi:hypothetical protein
VIVFEVVDVSVAYVVNAIFLRYYVTVLDLTLGIFYNESYIVHFQYLRERGI